MKHFGNIEIPVSLVNDIDEHIHLKLVEYKTKHYHDPKFIVLNRISYGALKANVLQKFRYDVIFDGGVIEYQGITIMCYPEQAEMVKCFGLPDNAFFYE